jgi:hypothetical protein
LVIHPIVVPSDDNVDDWDGRLPTVVAFLVDVVMQPASLIRPEAHR